MTERGIRNLGWGEVDKTVDHPAQHQFWAVWEIQSAEAVAGFMQSVRESGWYNYFDQQNIAGCVQSAHKILQSMLAN